MKLYFEILKLEKDGVVRLDDNKACKLHDVGTIRLTIFDDREFFGMSLNLSEIYCL